MNNWDYLLSGLWIMMLVVWTVVSGRLGSRLGKRTGSWIRARLDGLARTKEVEK